jgi:hypothetical protein
MFASAPDRRVFLVVELLGRKLRPLSNNPLPGAQARRAASQGGEMTGRPNFNVLIALLIRADYICSRIPVMNAMS